MRCPSYSTKCTGLIVLVILLLTGAYIFSLPSPSISISEKDTSDTSYVRSVEEEKEVLQEIRDQRDELRSISAEESHKMMKEQTEECNKPFEEFLEKYGVIHVDINSRGFPILPFIF